LRTGEPLSLPAYDPVPVYPVRLEGDDVLVDVKNPLNQDT
jgi:3-phenylpropionate/trans-cinnamate dioxygenase ferredoxin component